MKKLVFLFLSICVLATTWAMYTTQQQAKVVVSPFVAQPEGEGEETDSPDQAIIQEYLMRYDPAINRVPTERLIAAQQAAQAVPFAT